MHQDRPDPSNTDLTKASKDGFEQRLEELDSFAAILPQGRNETLAHLLEDEDVATLRHLAHEGMGENSLRALASDFGYLQAWCRVATGYSLPWPAPEDLVLKFIAHHLWSEIEKAKNPDHGMPQFVGDHLRSEGLLRTSGPHSPGTVQRRLASWSTLHRWRALEGPFSSPAIRAAMRLAVRVADRPRKRKSKKPITADILEEILKTCQAVPPMRPTLRDYRDAAILMLGFASGGRRRSELAALRLSQIQFDDPVLADPNDADSKLLPCLTLTLGRTKTEDGSDDNDVVLIGRPVHALQRWLKVSKLSDGTVFRAIDQWGHVSERALSAQSVNLIIKDRIKKAGLNPEDYSAHGLRSGFLTEAANRDIPLQDAMLQSRHKSVIQASRYYSEASKGKRKSARLLG